MNTENVFALPESDDELLEQCEVQTFRSGGKGGQHVNKTESGVRLIHRATGIAVTCQSQRSQYLNKIQCLKNLRKKIIRAQTKPPPRIPTGVPVKAKRSRKIKKQLQSEKKRFRREIEPE